MAMTFYGGRGRPQPERQAKGVAAWLLAVATPFGKPQGVPPKRPSAGLGACHPTPFGRLQTMPPKRWGYWGTVIREVPLRGAGGRFLSGFAGLFYFL